MCVCVCVTVNCDNAVNRLFSQRRSDSAPPSLSGIGSSQPFSFLSLCYAESPTQNPFNRTLSPARRDELAKIRQRQLANAVHYIWETGEDKFAFRYFHTGFWESCEKHNDGEHTILGPLVHQYRCVFLWKLGLPVSFKLVSYIFFCSYLKMLSTGEKCRSFIELTPGETQGELRLLLILVPF